MGVGHGFGDFGEFTIYGILKFPLIHGYSCSQDKETTKYYLFNEIIE
jgi:hypothetical protein